MAYQKLTDGQAHQERTPYLKQQVLGIDLAQD